MSDVVRRVMVSVHSDGSGDFSISGFFHRWGQFSEIVEGKEVGGVYAVVEHESDGKVEIYRPRRIQFTDNNRNTTVL